LDLIAETLGAADSLEALSARLSLETAEYELGELIRLQTRLEVVADHGTSVLPCEPAASGSDGVMVIITSVSVDAGRAFVQLRYASLVGFWDACGR
jgi:hypothetical protein